MGMTMSSKFSRMAVSQKPPGVCRAPPEGPEFIPPPLVEQIFDGYVDFENAYSGWPARFISPLHMTPNPPARVWTGRAVNGPGTLELEMYYYEPGNYFNFDIAVFHNATPIEQWAMTKITPRSWRPFDTGLLWPDPPPTNGHLRFRILA